MTPDAALRWRLEPSAAPGRRRPNAALPQHGGRRRRRPTAEEQLDPLLVALRSFTTNYYGQHVEITAGRDWVRASHRIAREHPDAFQHHNTVRTEDPA